MWLRGHALALALLNYGLTFIYNQGPPMLVQFADIYDKWPTKSINSWQIYPMEIHAWQMSGLEILLPPYHSSKDDSSDYCTCGATPDRHKHPHFCPCLLRKPQTPPLLPLPPQTLDTCNPYQCVDMWHCTKMMPPHLPPDYIIGFALGNTQPFAYLPQTFHSNKIACPSHIISLFYYFTYYTN